MMAIISKSLVSIYSLTETFYLSLNPGNSPTKIINIPILQMGILILREALCFVQSLAQLFSLWPGLGRLTHLLSENPALPGAGVGLRLTLRVWHWPETKLSSPLGMDFLER